MNKILFCLCLFFISLNALDLSVWTQTKRFEMGKDEVQRLRISDGVFQKELFFRWTLFHNEGIVLHINYDGFVSQNILYKKYKQDAKKIILFPTANRAKNDSYLFIKFVDYFYDKKRAVFDILLKDSAGKNLIKE